MKKTVRVIIEKEIEIDIPDGLLTNSFITEFEGYMFELDDDDKRDGLFKHVGWCHAKGIEYAEGIGHIRTRWEQEKFPAEVMIVARTIVDDTETEIVE